VAHAVGVLELQDLGKPGVRVHALVGLEDQRVLLEDGLHVGGDQLVRIIFLFELDEHVVQQTFEQLHVVLDQFAEVHVLECLLHELLLNHVEFGDFTLGLLLLHLFTQDVSGLSQD